MERNDVIVEMFGSIRGMVYNFARKFNLEFDDCLQDAAEIMLNVYSRIPQDCTNVQGYLNRAIRGELYQSLRNQHETISLDAPISADSEMTFADMLETFTQEETQRTQHITKTVHNALRDLSLEVQLHAMSFYGLGAYDPAIPSRRRHKVKYGRKKSDMRQSLRVAFRQNPQILALIQ